MITIERLRERDRGEVICPRDAGFDEARHAHKARINQHDYNRLVEAKRNCDPDNLFHLNQNVRP
ncbi:BBE domain-containing protein [Saccharopolyspora sp. 5N708]|uniref:BBE domain-containing protein n=1 Tax=Saccharopolyspora sp. 5N708 TaxID=3457424 RepID=UPI003FD0F6F5